MKLTKKYIFIFSCIFSFSFLYAQEHLAPLRTNPVLVRYTQEAKKTHSVTWRLLSDSIMAKLPFLDDFSRPGPYPFDSLWMDNAAFINNTYPTCPHTLGVATLDGVNNEGQPYNPSCPPGGSLPADSLTSRPINLAIYKSSDSLYLSFYYQAGGRSPSPPQTADTLLLQFRTNQTPWTTIWYHLGYTPSATDTNFHLVMIPINDTTHYSGVLLNPFENNFQFRFKNYACTSGNVDQWNIDEVYMNWHRAYFDTNQYDVAFVYESPSLLANYQYMPWEQFTANDVADTMYIQERNNSLVPITMTYNYTINNTTPPTLCYPNGSVGNIYPFYEYGYQDYPPQTHIPIKSRFSYSPLTGPTDITLTHILYATNDFIRQNDTLRFDQVFSNYYAYDDGTAEASYFINGSTPLYLAYGFTLNNPDTLRGLLIAFNYMFVNPANYSFRLAVWDNSGPGGTPGVLRFEDDSIYSPGFTGGDTARDSLNGFVYYPFHFDKDSTIPAGATIYVGYIQTYGDSLNVGYDLNTDHHTQIYYWDNAYPPEDWQQGTYSGSMMMRPVFGAENYHAPVLQVSALKSPYVALSMYPNPANDRVKLSAAMEANTVLRIYSADGRECLSNNNFSGNLLNTSSLTPGFYIVEITPPGGNTFYQKLLIER